MPVEAEAGKSSEELEKHDHRNNEFYSQTIAENNARLLAKFPNDPKLRTELEFIHAGMIIAGRP